MQAPFDPALKRFENGLQTTNVTEKPILERHTWTPALQLERASYAGTIVTDRRYPVVDTELAERRRYGMDGAALGGRCEVTTPS